VTIARRIAVALAVAALAATGCGTPGAEDEATTGGGATTGGQVQTEGFENLGPVNLTVWTYDNQDPGLRPVLEELTKRFEERYPNVSIDIVFKDFNGLVGTVPRALASNEGPDITEGNQGFQTDAALVRARLIRPLDSYIDAYGWDSWYSDSTWSMFRWNEDGTGFGQGTTWGVAQTGQNVGVYVNKAKLRQVGVDPDNMPTTFDEFDAMLADIRAKLPRDEPVIELGNKEGYGTIHVFGGIQGAFVDPQDVRGWIYHEQGASYDTPENVQALAKFQEWGEKGYFNDDVNAVGNDASAVEFAKGTGVFWIGGNWNAQVIRDGLGEDAMVMNVPPGASGQHAAIGATSGPWHISAKTEFPDVAAAWLDYVIGSDEAVDLMYQQNQIPAVANAEPPPNEPYLGQVTDSWQQLVDDDGLLLYTDWASPTMYQTLASNYQQLLAGRISPEEMAQAVQADWEKFDQTLR
jgi:raffinose/stachyose/melibiose transport system substrate-binding protein